MEALFLSKIRFITKKANKWRIKSWLENFSKYTGHKIQGSDSEPRL